MRHNNPWRNLAISRCIRRLTTDESGQDLIEYALLAGFVVIAIYVTLPQELMPAVSSIFSKIGSTFSQAPS